MRRLTFKQPSESFVEVVSFKPLLSSGETVSYANVDKTVARGAAADAVNIVGTVLASSDTARLQIQKGTHDNDYGIRVLVSTSLSNTWEEDLVQPVWDFLKI